MTDFLNIVPYANHLPCVRPRITAKYADDAAIWITEFSVVQSPGDTVSVDSSNRAPFLIGKVFMSFGNAPAQQLWGVANTVTQGVVYFKLLFF